MALRDRVGQERTTRRESVNLVSVYLERLLAEVDRDALHGLNEVQRRARLERQLGEILSVEGPVMADRERSLFIRRVVDEALGLGVLEPLLADESITEIMVNGPHDVFVERRGRLERHPTAFASEEQLMQTIDRIVSSVNRRVDESSPMVDARLASGERVNVIIPPLSLNGPTLTIRRFPRPYRLPELVAKGTLDEVTLLLLSALVRARFSIVISGGTGSGKTTFLNALSGLIPATERIVTIEDAAELSLQQEHVVRLESRPPNVEGKGRVTIVTWSATACGCGRSDHRRRSGAGRPDMLQAMNTGHGHWPCTPTRRSTPWPTGDPRPMSELNPSRHHPRPDQRRDRRRGAARPRGRRQPSGHRDLCRGVDQAGGVPAHPDRPVRSRADDPGPDRQRVVPASARAPDDAHQNHRRR